VEALVREQLALEKAYGIAGSERKVESDSAFVQLAKALALVTEMREPYLRGHAEQVRSLATQIAVSLGCPDQFVRNIGFAALIHDIGKVVIPERILFKKGRLSRTEYAEVKRYPMVSVDILRDVEYFKDVTPIVESQQEWYDGSGYPNKLKGKAIPLGARILAVADAYDAMTSIRPYRPSMDQEEATSRLREGAGTQWDPLVVDALLRMLDRQQDDMQEHPVTT
jgi:HD-GYP domain-containing protein (c-di-GMP phosphodiesterase class II)